MDVIFWISALELVRSIRSRLCLLPKPQICCTVLSIYCYASWLSIDYQVSEGKKSDASLYFLSPVCN